MPTKATFRADADRYAADANRYEKSGYLRVAHAAREMASFAAKQASATAPEGGNRQLYMRAMYVPHGTKLIDAEEVRIEIHDLDVFFNEPPDAEIPVFVPDDSAEGEHELVVRKCDLRSWVVDGD